MAVAATASRVSACANATSPGPGSRTSPASRAGASASSTCSASCPAIAASTSSEHSPAQDGGEQQQRPGVVGQSFEASGDHVADRGRQRVRVGVAAEPGQLDQEERVAAGAGLPLAHLVRAGVARELADQRPGGVESEPGEVEPGDVMTGELLADVRE